MQQADFLVRQRYMEMASAPGDDGEEIPNLQKIYHELTELLTQLLQESDVSSSQMKFKQFKGSKSILVQNSMVSFEEMFEKTPVFQDFDKPKFMLQNLF